MSLSILKSFNLNNHQNISYGGSCYDINLSKNTTYKIPTISIIGLKRIGTIASACFSKIGVPVIGVDSDKKNILEINSGHAYFHENGLNLIIQDGVKRYTFSATYSILDAIVKKQFTSY